MTTQIFKPFSRRNRQITRQPNWNVDNLSKMYKLRIGIASKESRDAADTQPQAASLPKDGAHKPINAQPRRINNFFFAQYRPLPALFVSSDAAGQTAPFPRF